MTTFWGNSSYGLQILKLQKRIIRIMSGLRSRDFCKNEFNNLKILLLVSVYIFFAVVNNTELYYTISQIHINMRHSFDLYQPHSNLISYQKGAYYFGIRLFNGLPLHVKKLAHNAKQFRLALSIFLHTQSFYTHDEYFNQRNLLR
jgi:hypothetical protein